LCGSDLECFFSVGKGDVVLAHDTILEGFLWNVKLHHPYRNVRLVLELTI
jgi:hypothetical protein